MKRNLLILTLAMALSSSMAFAETKPSAATAWDAFTFTYAGLIEGPSLSKPFQGGQPNGDTGKPDAGPITWKHYISPGFKVSPNVTFAFTFYTISNPGVPAPKSADDAPLASAATKMKDSYLKLNNSKFYVNGGFNVATSTRAYFPMSKASQAVQRVIALEQRFYNNYDIPNTKWTLGMNTYFTMNFYHDDAVATYGVKGATPSQPLYQLYAGPNINYQITPTVGINLLYELGCHSERVHFNGLNFFNDGTDFEPGVSWDATPNLNINPYLNFYTGQRLAADTTSYNLLFSWKLK